LGWLAAIVIAIVAGMLLRRPRLVFVGLGAAIGYAAMAVSAPGEMPIGERCRVRGVVVENDDFGATQRLVVDCGGHRRVAISLYDYQYTVEQGDSVSCTGRLLPAVREQSVEDERNGVQFALTRYLSARLETRTRDFAIVADASGLRGWLNGLRNSLLERIRYSGLTQPAADFLSAVLLGADMVDSDLRQEFARAGLSHVLALSGTHVSVIALLITLLFLPVELAGSRRLRLLITILLLWAFAMLTGMSPSVVRAAVMATFLLLGKLVGRNSSALNSLCMAAMAILLVNPAALFLPGFQLSFFAVIGILLILPMVEEGLERFRIFQRGWAMSCAKAVALPVAAVVATAPLAALHFHAFPVWFLLANLPVAILLPLMLAGGVLLVVLACCGVEVSWLAGGINRMYAAVSGLAHYAATLPGNELGEELYFSAWLLLPIYGGLLLLWLAWNCRRRLYLYCGAILAVGALLLLPIANPVYPQEELLSYHDGRAINLLYRQGTDVYLITDANPKHYPELQERCELLLADYLGKRHAILRAILPLGGEVANRRFLIIRGGELPGVDAAADFVIVTAGFRGDILEVAASYPGIPIILSPALPAQRRRLCASRLREAAIPFRLTLAL
jgi:ComEC/Rec2-related protein